MQPKSECDQVSISVTVEGKVQYTGGFTSDSNWSQIGNNTNIPPQPKSLTTITTTMSMRTSKT